MLFYCVIVFATFLAVDAAALGHQTRDVDGQSGCLFDGRVYAPNEMITIPKCLGEMRCLGNNNYSPITPLYGNCQNKRDKVDGQSGCLFDGRVYAPNEMITIPKCLGEMRCLGNNNYSPITPLYGNCQNKRDKVDGQSGCLFDGRVYAPNEMITIPKCLGEMRCLGNNNYSPITPLYGNCQNKRDKVDGQSGCLFDGRVYAPNEMITIPKCLGEMRCLGNNNYSPIKPLYGNCQNKRASVDGQTGCLFDGKVYAPNEEIVIPKCLAKFTCLGNNNYSNLIALGGVC